MMLRRRLRATASAIIVIPPIPGITWPAAVPLPRPLPAGTQFYAGNPVSPANLAAAITAANGGDVILVSGGVRANFTSTAAVTKTPAVVVRSINPFDPLIIRSPINTGSGRAVRLENFNGLVFEDVVFEVLDAVVGDAEFNQIVRVLNCTDVAFNRCTSRGSENANGVRHGYGLYVQGGSNVSVRNHRFETLSYALQAINTNGLEIVGADSDGVSQDAFNLTGCTDLKLYLVTCRGFKVLQPSAHADAVQIKTQGATQITSGHLWGVRVLCDPSLPLIAFENGSTYSAGRAQGLFIRNETAGPYGCDGLFVDDVETYGAGINAICIGDNHGTVTFGSNAAYDIAGMPGENAAMDAQFGWGANTTGNIVFTGLSRAYRFGPFPSSVAPPGQAPNPNPAMRISYAASEALVTLWKVQRLLYLALLA